MKRFSLALVVCVVCSSCALFLARAADPVGKSLKPCVAITGTNSHVTKCRYERITSTDQWTRVWQEHKGEKPNGQYDSFYDPLTRPLIDFDNYMVIAIFQGNGWNNAGLTAVSITAEESRIVFRFEDNFYQTNTTSASDDLGKRVAVYGFFVVPRSAKPVVLEENTERSGAPPVWKELVTLPKL